MAATNAMTPISGTNGYQQQVSIDPNEPLQLSVTNASGEVRIGTSSQSGVWVVVRRSDGHPGDDEEAIPIAVDVDGNHISVHPDWALAGGFANLARKIKDHLQNGLNPHDWDFSALRLNPDLNYDIRVEIPQALAEGSKVSAKTASGRLSVNDVTADVSAITASGRIDLRNLKGTVTTSSASGSIHIQQVEGSLEANTASGSIRIEDGEAWLAARTVSGSIGIERFTMKNARIASVSGSVTANVRADNAQDYGFSTVSGSVKLNLALPANATSTLSSRSASGSAKASGDFVATGKRSWTAGSGPRGPVFNVKTVSGSLKAFGTADPGVAARSEALPANVPGDSGDDQPDAGHDHDQHGGFEGEFNVDNMTNWAKDFARDFRKGFASLATPPVPDDVVPPSPPRPAAPGAPGIPATPPSSTAPLVPPTPFGNRSSAEDEARAQADEARAQADEARVHAEEQRVRAEEERIRAEEEHRRAGEEALRASEASPSSQSWTWSSSSGTSTPPVTTAPAGDSQQTEPVTTPEPAVTATPAGIPAEDAERLRVLEALERGDIDVEEALARLDPDDAQGS